jgi:hypothetical protein
MGDLVTHRGGCHCGKVRIQVSAPAILETVECNCSMCEKKGFLHLHVTRSQIVIEGEEHLTSYSFGTHTAKHLFCSFCGICSFYIPRSFPEGYSVNVKCLDRSTIEDIKVAPSTG